MSSAAQAMRAYVCSLQRMDERASAGRGCVWSVVCACVYVYVYVYVDVRRAACGVQVDV